VDTDGAVAPEVVAQIAAVQGVLSARVL